MGEYGRLLYLHIVAPVLFLMTFAMIVQAGALLHDAPGVSNWNSAQNPFALAHIRAHFQNILKKYHTR